MHHHIDHPVFHCSSTKTNLFSFFLYSIFLSNENIGPVIAILMLLPSLNSCVNPWIYIYFNPNLITLFCQFFRRKSSGEDPSSKVCSTNYNFNTINATNAHHQSITNATVHSEANNTSSRTTPKKCTTAVITGTGFDTGIYTNGTTADSSCKSIKPFNNCVASNNNLLDVTVTKNGRRMYNITNPNQTLNYNENTKANNCIL